MTLLFSTVFIAKQANAAQAYQLDSGDTISISVFGEPDLQKEIIINNRGSINFPFLGEISVKGLTLSELEIKIVDGLKPDYFINPNVSVVIKQYRPFFIKGQVKSSGAYPYQPGLTVDKAVVLAGGFTERASRDKIFIIRAKDASKKSVNVAIDAEVFPGDIITVKQSFF